MNRPSYFLIAGAALLIATATACKTDPPPKPGEANLNRPSPSASQDQFAATRGLYEKNCKLCHGANGEGGPVKLDDGTKLKVPSLREGHALRHPDSDFVKQINKGGDGMPAFGDKLKPEEVTDL